MGSWAQLVRHQIPPQDNDQRTGVSRLHRQVHNPRSRRDPRRWTDGWSKLTGFQPKKEGEWGSSLRDVLRYRVQLQFPTTNNEVEYKTILTRLKVEKALGARNLLLQSDSKLVIRQINGEYEAKEDRMQKYLRLMNYLTQEFDQVDFT